MARVRHVGKLETGDEVFELAAKWVRICGSCFSWLCPAYLRRAAAMMFTFHWMLLEISGPTARFQSFTAHRVIAPSIPTDEAARFGEWLHQRRARLR
jgi:hypothetical protein